MLLYSGTLVSTSACEDIECFAKVIKDYDTVGIILGQLVNTQDSFSAAWLSASLMLVLLRSLFGYSETSTSRH